MLKEYKTILGEATYQEEIDKSIFIASIKRCNSEEESLEFIEQIRKKYKDATHNCTAYINGESKLTQRYNDDGEPQGTAGIPMLEVLKKEDLTDLAVVVTRYLGGKKLGASGLIRAYGGAVSGVLREAEIVWLRNYYLVDLNFDYSHLGRIDNFIGNKGYYLKNREYLEKIENKLYISVDEFENFKKEILELTSGDVYLQVVNNLLLQVNSNCQIIE